MPEGINLGEIWASIGLDLQPLLREVQRAREVIRAADRELTQSAQQAGVRASRAFASVQEAYAQMLANLALRPKLTPEEFEQFAARGREAIASMMAAERQHLAEVSRMAQEHRRTMSQLAQDHRQAMRSMAEETKKNADQARTSLSGMAAAIQNAFTAAFSLYALRQTVRTLTDMTAEAFRAEAGFRILERMLARTGQSADEAMSRLRALSSELRVPVEVLAQAAGELTRYGFTIEQITDIFRGAAASGMLLGKSAADSIRIVNEALISQRSVMLNEIGIVENLDYAFQQYAKSLNKTADELTQTERAQAAWLMITRATAGEVADLPTLLQGYGGAVADLGQEMYRAQLAAGRALVPALTELARAGATVFTALQPFAGTLGFLAQTAVPMLASVITYQLINALNALRTTLLTTMAAINPLHAAIGALVGVLAYFGLKAASAARESRPFYEESRARAQRLRSEADELDRLIKRFEELSGKPRLSAEEQRELQTVMEAIKRIQPGLVAGYDDLRRAIEANINPLKQYVEHLRNASDSEIQLAAQRAQLEIPGLRAEKARLETEIKGLQARKDEAFKRYVDQFGAAAEALPNLDRMIREARAKLASGAPDLEAFKEIDQLLKRIYGADYVPGRSPRATFLVALEQTVKNSKAEFDRLAQSLDANYVKLKAVDEAIQRAETAIAAWQRVQKDLPPFPEEKPAVAPRVQKDLPPFPEEKPAVAPPVPSKDTSKEAQKVLRDLIQLEADALEALGSQREAALLRERAQHEQALAELKKAFNDKLITQEQYNKAVELENQLHNAEIANINKQFDEDEARRLIEKVRFEQDLLDAQEGESQARRLAAYQATLQQLKQSTEAYRQFALEIQRLQNETNDQRVQDQVERIRFEKQGAAEIADAIQQVLDEERMSARLRKELTREVARLRKQAADEALALEREGARQQMELADQATRVLVAAIDRRVKDENLYAVEHAQLLRDLVAQADRGLVQMNWALRQELLQRAEDLERVGRERADEMVRQGAESARRLAEEATRAWMAHVREMGETGQWGIEQQIASLRDLIREYQLTGELRADVEREIAQLQDAADEEAYRLASERADQQVEQLRQIQAAVAQTAREQVESIERANLPLFRQLDALFALRTALGELGDAGRRAFEEVVGPAIVRVVTQLENLRDEGQRMLESFRTPAGGMARIRAVEFSLPVGPARDLKAAERLYAEIAEVRIRASDAALADEEARFEASLQRQVEMYRRAGLEQAEIDAWLAAQREAFDAERLRRRVEMERQAAKEVQRTWAEILLGPFADPLDRFVRRLGEFRVAERLRSAVDELKEAFGRLIPDALKDGLVRVLSWFRDQAGRVGEWLQGGLSWLGEQAGSLLGRVGTWAGQALGGVGQAVAGALGGAGQAIGGVVSNALGALGSAAGAAAGALGALAGPVLDLVAALVEASPQFKQLTEVYNAILQDVAAVFGALIEPIIPVLKEFHNALRPILQQLYPILRMFGGILAQVVKVMTPFLLFIYQLLIPIFRALFPVIKAVGVAFATVAGMIGDAWNLIARALNSVLGWAGVNLPTIDTGAIYAARDEMLKMELPEEGTQEELPSGETRDSGDGGNRGTQISQITGPTRDLLVELLRPLTGLNILPGLFENLRNAALEIRDLLAASLGTSLAGAADALTAAATSLSDAAARLVTAVEALTESLRSEGGALVIDLVQSMEIAQVASVTIARADVIQVAQAGTVQVVGGRVWSPFGWLLGLRGVGA